MTTPTPLTEDRLMRDATVGRRLRELREAEGLSLRQVAATIGMDHSTIAKIETGQDYATDRMVRLLCTVYDAEADDLLLERDIDRVPPRVRRAIERAAYEQGIGDGIAMERGMLTERAERAERELAALREALEGLYRQDFRHRGWCALVKSEWVPGHPGCDCDLPGALKAAREAMYGPDPEPAALAKEEGS